MTRLHICLFENNYPNKSGAGGGGAGWYLKTISEQHIKQGHKVTLVKRVLNKHRQNYTDDVGVRVVHFHYSSKFLTYLSKIFFLNIFTRSIAYVYHGWIGHKEIIKLNKIHKFDVLEFTEGGNFWIGFFKKFKYISHLHCSHYTIYRQCDLRLPVGHYLERLISFIAMNRADAILSPSKAMISIVEKEKNGKFKNKYVIPLAVEKNITSFHEKNTKFVKFIFASRNDYLKGGDTLLKAIDLVNKNYSGKTKFYFIGYEPNKDYSYQSNIVFKKFMPRNELLEFYNHCHVALLPTHFDNSPLFVYEAMAAALPVIATNIGGIPELIKHGKTGYLFNKMDHLQLSNYIIDLIEDVKKREMMGNNAQNFIRNYASVEKIAEQKLNLYRKIIGVNCRAI